MKAWDRIFQEELKDLKPQKHYESVYTLNPDKFNEIYKTRLPSTEITIDYKEYLILPGEFHELPYIDP